MMCFNLCSWHWLLCTSPMIFSRSSILKGREHLVWIIISNMSSFYVSICICFLSIYSVEMLLNSLIICRYLETIFSRQNSDCTVEQFVQSINAIHYLVKVFAWLGVIQFTYKSVVQVLFSIIQPTAKKSTYAMLHYISLHFMLHRITRELDS